MGAHAVSLGDRLLRPRRVRQFDERLPDGATTTVYVASYPRRATRVRVVALDRPEPLHRWARQAGIAEALSGGFYVGGGSPLGELHSGGHVHMTVPFESPWDACRSCMSVIDGRVEIVPRGVLPNRARGDLLQAGPLLVANGRPLIADPRDPQGFSAGAGQFDCDITEGRHPRAAFGIARDRYLAVVCDGRSIRDAGTTLGELSRLMADLGAEIALNLCGGASASLISGGALHNRPRDQNGVSLLGGRPVASAIVFER
ncbi:MAG TPA: phosphodiester glycosidase family protein [Thermoleophilaceae bacterium]|nr:phosphodiester glycosidase family protein [Thermoleophilaceae bacterium]